MKFSSILALSLFGLATASPFGKRKEASEEESGDKGKGKGKSKSKDTFPTKKVSKGFKLVVNVTDSSLDFKPSINNYYITSIHTGAGLNLVGVNEKDGPIFYQNGTAKELKNNKADILFDAGTPNAPYGLSLPKDKKNPKVPTAYLNVGPGTPGVQLNPSNSSYSYVLPESFLACNESIPYYQGKYFIIIKESSSVKIGKNYKKKDVPQNCVPVRLVPECAKLNNLTDDAISSHKYALESECYADVSSLKWKNFTPETNKKC